MGAAERIEWQRESPALLRSDHPCDTVGDERETLLWWSQHPVLLWSEHPCDTAWDEIDPEICQSPANDNARLFLPLSGTTNTPTLVLRSKAISAGREKAAPSPATDQTTRTEEGSAPILDIFPLARAVMAEGSAAGARALGEEARPERRTRQGEAQPAQAQAALTYITFSDNRRAEQAGGWGLPQWPEGAKPVTKKIEYDDLYRATRIRYDYSEGDDTWDSPFQAEIEAAPSQQDPRRSEPSPHIAFQKRILQQTFEYDWLGNNEKTTDDASGFYDRSLGDISNDSSGGNPYQLKSATLPGESGGSLEARYDAAGNMTKMALQREGQCLGGATAGDCSQQFVYDWDEVGRLVRARRWDNNLDSVDAFEPTAGTPAADLRHTYDASDQRVIKEAVDAQGEQSFTLYVFATMELRKAQYGSAFAEAAGESDYEVSGYTVVPYLMANGVRLARLVYHGSDEVPEEDASSNGSYGDVNASVSNLHVFFELGDHLGSTSVVLDKATGELVERATFQGYGGAESDYRPGRWKSFREDYRFTGKEEDVEVGLQYFGKRFLNPLLGRWVSADPLAVHVPGRADLNIYAYVSGQIVTNVDPLGLEEKDTVKVTFVPDDVRAQADAAGIDPDNPGEGNSFAFRDNRNGKVLVYASDDPSALSRSEYEATHFREGGGDGDKGGSCAGAGVCGTAGPGQESVKGELDVTDGISQLDGAITEQSLGEEGGKKDGSIGGGCKSCEGTDLKQAIKSGINAAVGAIGQIGALAVKWFKGLSKVDDAADVMRDVNISRSKYPESAAHIEDAQAAGHPEVLTIDRGGADANRAASLKDHPVVPDKQRDEYPPAMFEEGGAGASVRPITPRDNMGAGACIGNQCRGLSDGDKVRIKITD